MHLDWKMMIKSEGLINIVFPIGTVQYTLRTPQIKYQHAQKILGDSTITL